MKEKDLTYDRFLNFFKGVNPSNRSDFQDNNNDDDDDDMDQPLGSKDTSNPSSAKSSSETPVLDNFGFDMTKAARENRLDPIVGREREIERLAQILSRNNFV